MLLALAASCDGSHSSSNDRGHSEGDSGVATSSASATVSAAPSAVPIPKCSAPSYAASEPFDARDAAAIERCAPLERGTRSCGSQSMPLDLAKLDAAVVPLDEATRAQVSAIAEKGKKLGRRPWAFGLVGDSMTISGDFMSDFSAGREARVELAPDVDLSLRIQGRRSIVDFYRARPVESGRDAFVAYRAAKSGMRAGWALEGQASPVSQLVERLSPAVAVVLYGGNDAAFGPAPFEDVLGNFTRDLSRIVDALEAAGIVPVLNTLARHLHAPGVNDCGSAMSNWRIAVQTNALSARVVELACERHLPLIDLRHALDAADAHGLGPDGVHLAAFPGGPAKLTARGLRCGANVRNYVTLKMLAALVPLVQ